MKCLSVQQPWARAIVRGHKRVENRTWHSMFRGEFAIHAGVSRESLTDGNCVVISLLEQLSGEHDWPTSARAMEPRCAFGVIAARVEGGLR